MRSLRFLTGCSPYQANEEAGFDDAHAADLVKRGLAEYTDEPKAAPAPAPVAKAAEAPRNKAVLSSPKSKDKVEL